MSEKEKKILETIATAVPKMSEFDKKKKTESKKAESKEPEVNADAQTV